MLCYQGLGDNAQAARERTLYERFKADESSQSITGPYRQLHAEDNNERQQIHEHRLDCASGAKVAGSAPNREYRRRTRIVRLAGSGVGSVAAALAVNATLGAAGRAAVRRRDDRGGHSLPAQQRRLRKEVPAGNARRRRRVPRRRQRRLAGHPVRELAQLAGAHGRAVESGALPQQSRTARSPTSPRQAGLAIEMYGLGVVGRRLRQRRRRRHLSHRRSARIACSAITATASSRTSPRGPASAIRGSRRARRGSTTTSDGKLDLFVANYVAVVAGTDLFCTLDGKSKSYCTPESYKGQSPTLYRNKGDGTFEDVTRKAGLYDPTAKSARRRAASTTTTTASIDLFVANDTQPNRLYRNNGNGTFTDVGMTAGRRVQRGRRRARRAWASTPPTTTAPAGRACHRQLLERDDGALLATKAPASSSTRRRRRPSARRRC